MQLLRVLIVLSLLSVGVFAAPRGYLHLVYVTNRDREPLPDYADRVHRMMVDVQDFFRTEMERNGYGPKTFRLDLDENGRSLVHLVTLDWDFDTERKFTPKDLRPAIAEQLQKAGIDIAEEYIITFQNAYWKDGDQLKYDVVYTGSGDPVRGATWVVDHELLDPENLDPAQTDRVNDRGQKFSVGRFNVKMIGGVAHEFGHALGLPHNKETAEEFKELGKALMGEGNYTYRQDRLKKKPTGSFLSPAHAFILSLHPLFTGKVPDNFDVPEVFIEDIVFGYKNGQLNVSGRVNPGEDAAGVVLYHDPLPTGVNKDYDAFSYLAIPDGNGQFSVAMPVPEAEACALHIKVYFRNGMHKKFRFTHKTTGGKPELEALRKDYLWEQAKYAYRRQDAAWLKKLVDPLEKADPMQAERVRRFLKTAGAAAPSEIPAGESNAVLSGTRWVTASVGWYMPMANGVIDPDSNWSSPLFSSEGRCAEGLYAHAPARYVYDLGGAWKKLETRFSIFRGRHPGSVEFVVKGDGKELFRSPLVTLADGEVGAEVDLAGVKKLELITESGPDGSESDWGIWISPTLIR